MIIIHCSRCLLVEGIIFGIMSHLAKNGANDRPMSALDIVNYEIKYFKKINIISEKRAKNIKNLISDG
jgi:hypothetical protein